MKIVGGGVDGSDDSDDSDDCDGSDGILRMLFNYYLLMVVLSLNNFYFL